MATDPTRRIVRRRRATPFAMGAEDILERLSQLSPSGEVPYLTVTVDWTVEGTSPGRTEPEEVKRSQSRSGTDDGMRWRPAVEILEQEIEDLIEEHGPRGDIFDSLTEDYKKITAFLENDLDPAAHGAIIVANSSLGVFEASGFSLQMPTSVTLSPVPALYSLVRLVEDNPVYGVLLADQQDATLSFLAHGGITRTVSLEASGYPRHQQSGGWSQRRYQARANERIEAFADDVAGETKDALERLGVDTLVVAGNEVMLSALDHAFHESVKECIAGTLNLDMTTSEDELFKATLPVAVQAERDRETAAVQRLHDAIGEGSRGASGQSDTLRALQNGQADLLLLNDTFEGRGWADFDMHVFGIDNHPTQHPVGGDLASIVDVDLREQMAWLALTTDAEIDVIHSDVPVPDTDEVPDAGEGRPMTDAAKELDELGGVGAVLRYALDETAPEQTV